MKIFICRQPTSHRQNMTGDVIFWSEGRCISASQRAFVKLLKAAKHESQEGAASS